jgi:hypothetical protein
MELIGFDGKSPRISKFFLEVLDLIGSNEGGFFDISMLVCYLDKNLLIFLIYDFEGLGGLFKENKKKCPCSWHQQ